MAQTENLSEYHFFDADHRVILEEGANSSTTRYWYLDGYADTAIITDFSNHFGQVEKILQEGVGTSFKAPQKLFLHLFRDKSNKNKQDDWINGSVYFPYLKIESSYDVSYSKYPKEFQCLALHEYGHIVLNSAMIGMVPGRGNRAFRNEDVKNYVSGFIQETIWKKRKGFYRSTNNFTAADMIDQKILRPLQNSIRTQNNFYPGLYDPMVLGNPVSFVVHEYFADMLAILYFNDPHCMTRWLKIKEKAEDLLLDSMRNADQSCEQASQTYDELGIQDDYTNLKSLRQEIWELYVEHGQTEQNRNKFIRALFETSIEIQLESMDLVKTYKGFTSDTYRYIEIPWDTIVSDVRNKLLTKIEN